MRIIPRSEWGSSLGNYNRAADQLKGPLNEWVAHTEAAVYKGTDLKSDMNRVRSIERYHVIERDFTGGIGYSFLISPIGNIFQGRGWLRVGAHTQQGRNSTAHAVCFLGHGDIDPATEAQWDSAAWLVGESIRLGHVSIGYVLSGHRNYTAKSCPGNLIYPHIGRLRGIRGPVTLPPSVPPTAPSIPPGLPENVPAEEEDCMFLRPLMVGDTQDKVSGDKHAYIYYYPADEKGKFIARSLPGGKAQADHMAAEMKINHHLFCGRDWYPLTDYLDGPLKNVEPTDA